MLALMDFPFAKDQVLVRTDGDPFFRAF